jgi:hypothetical protein
MKSPAKTLKDMNLRVAEPHVQAIIDQVTQDEVAVAETTAEAEVTSAVPKKKGPALRTKKPKKLKPKKKERFSLDGPIKRLNVDLTEEMYDALALKSMIHKKRISEVVRELVERFLK